MKLILIVLFLVYYSSSTGQTIVIRDNKTKIPVENVVIYNLEKSLLVQTNSNGAANISEFKDKDILIFQHPAYIQFSLKKSEITRLQIELTEKVIKFDEVVISANKWEQDISEVPNKILAISPESVAFSESQTSADILKNTGQVFVQKSQLGGGSPMIRGFAANSVLIVVDGVRMNNAIYRSGNLQNIISVDPHMIEGAEVIYGPGSVLYGSDALGGVMDFHLKNPSFSSNNKRDFSLNSMIRYSSANNEKTSNIQFNLSSQKLAFSGGFTFSDFDDLLTGNKRTNAFPDFGKRIEYVARISGTDSVIANSDSDSQVPSGFSQYSLLGKLKYRPNQKMEVGYGIYFSNTSDIPRYDRLIEFRNGIPRFADWHYGPQKWMMHRIEFGFYESNPIFDQSKVIISYQDYQESRQERNYKDPVLKSRNESVDIITLNVEFDKSIRDDKQVYYGVEGNYNQVKTNALSTDIETGQIGNASTRYPDGGSKTYFIAGYLSYKWNIGVNSILSIGGRLTYSSLKSRFNDTTFFNFPYDEIKIDHTSINGNLGYVLKPGNNVKFDFLISTGFRAPNVDDIGKVFDSEPGNVVVPNENLTPENTYNFEVTTTTKLFSESQLSITGFYTFLDNAIVRRDFQFNGMDSIIYDGSLSNVQALVNTNQAWIYGASLQLKGEISKFFYYLSSLTITNGEDKSGIPLRHTTPLFGKTTLGFAKNKLRLESYVEYNGKREYDELPPSEQNKTHLYTSDGALAWFTLNLKSSYRFNDYLTMNFGIENILNHHYRPYSSGISSPGRNFIVSIRANIN